jgi:lipopolysaccharide transport system permease protein
MEAVTGKVEVYPYRSSDAEPGLLGVWQHRKLLRSLIERQLKVKYQRSILGFAWTLMNPLLILSVLILVFSFVVRINLERYWAFLLSGYFVWNYTSQMLGTATSILAEHAQFNRSIAFPSEVPVLSAALAKLVEFGIELTVVLAVLAVLHHGTVPASWVLVPLLVVLMVVLAVGLMLPIAILSVYFNDVAHGLPVLIFLGFYASPVFYPVSFVPEAIQPYYYLNPLTHLLTMFHDVLYGGVWPSPVSMAVTVTVCLLVGVIGYGVFRRYKHACVEIA